MKVICDREKLREGLAIVNSVIPAKSPRPVMENVCLVATDEALELVGTDLEVAIRYRLDGGYFGGRDHSTVLHAVKKLKRMSEEEPRVRELLTELVFDLQGPGPT